MIDIEPGLTRTRHSHTKIIFTRKRLHIYTPEDFDAHSINFRQNIKKLDQQHTYQEIESEFSLGNF
jgi:hypothetical protein